MDIDWFTVIAQIVNFLILVGLLTKLLYRPIMNAMQEREEEIEDRMASAEKKRQQAEQEKSEYEQRVKEIEQKRDEMLSDAREDARQKRQRLMEQARSEVEKLEQQWRRTLRREQETFLSELRRRTGREVCRIAREALEDLANAELEQMIAEVFTKKIRQLDEEDAASVRQGVREDDGKVYVTSAFGVDADLRRSIGRALEERLERECDIHYYRGDTLVCGIELRAGGCKVGWSVASYLQELEETLLEQIDQQVE